MVEQCVLSAIQELKWAKFHSNGRVFCGRWKLLSDAGGGKDMNGLDVTKGGGSVSAFRAVNLFPIAADQDLFGGIFGAEKSSEGFVLMCIRMRCYDITP
jgi:hypothetical protein